MRVWVCRLCWTRLRYAANGNGFGRINARGWAPRAAYASSAAGSQMLDERLRKRGLLITEQFKHLINQSSNDLEAYTDDSVKRQKQLSDLQPVVEAFNDFHRREETVRELWQLANATEDEELKALASDELEEAENALKSGQERLEAMLVPRHPQAEFSALFEIRPGVGGDEAALFAQDLMRMYQRYASSIGWKFRPISVTKLEGSGGITEAIFTIDGEGAFGRFRGEGGVHRVQRNPSTDTKGRIHTSTASVVVLAEIPEGRVTSDVELDMSQVTIETMRASGPGGQNVNKLETAVRAKHVPTGITVSMQDERSQAQNKAKALLVLRSRVNAQKQAEQADKERKSKQIQSRITDHRSNFTLHDLEGCMEGSKLELLLEHVERFLGAQDLEEALRDSTAG